MRIFERLFLVTYISMGVWACLHVGISWDELVEYETLITNINAVQGLFSGNLADYQALLQYRDRYYGIGFHLISQTITQILLWVNSHIFVSSEYPSVLVFGHISIFAAFVISGLLIKSILEKLISDAVIASLGMMTYLLWPYLLGHALVNVKDIPFLFVWLLCTSIHLKILHLWYIQSFREGKQSLWQFCLLGLATAWLLSIRISGLLIFIEYAIGLVVYLLLGKCRLKTILSPRHVLAFGIPAVLVTFVLYPVYWHSPLEVMNAIQYMSQHPWDGDTLTAGQFLPPKQHTYFYIAAWLLVKLPILLLAGFGLLPFVLYRTFVKGKKELAGLQLLNFYWLLLTVIAILFTLIIMRAGLYNELRQILFIFPLIYIVGLTSIYYISKQLLYVGLMATSIIFTMDNLALYPYSYTYLNEVSRQMNVGSRYEKDYLGLSINRSTAWLNQKAKSDIAGLCVVVTPAHLWDGLNKTKFPCIRGYENFISLKNPFYFSWLVRDRVDLLPLPTCKLVHEEGVSLPLSSTKLVLNQVFFCNPNTIDK